MIINCPTSKGPAAWLTSVKQPLMVIQFYLINAHRTMGWPGSVLERDVVTSLALCRLNYLSSLLLSRQFLSPPHVRPTNVAIAGWLAATYIGACLYCGYMYAVCVCGVMSAFSLMVVCRLSLSAQKWTPSWQYRSFCTLQVGVVSLGLCHTHILLAGYTGYSVYAWIGQVLLCMTHSTHHLGWASWM